MLQRRLTCKANLQVCGGEDSFDLFRTIESHPTHPPQPEKVTLCLVVFQS